MDAEHYVDAKGLKCPMPIIHLQRCVRNADTGDRVCIEYTDPHAFKDIQSWCRINRHTLLSDEPIRKTADNPNAVNAELYSVLIKVN